MDSIIEKKLKKSRTEIQLDKSLTFKLAKESRERFIALESLMEKEDEQLKSNLYKNLLDLNNEIQNIFKRR